MLYVTLVLLFLAVAVLIVISSLQVNTFIKKANALIEKVESHIYL